MNISSSSLRPRQRRMSPEPTDRADMHTGKRQRIDSDARWAPTSAPVRPPPASSPSSSGYAHYPETTYSAPPPGRTIYSHSQPPVSAARMPAVEHLSNEWEQRRSSPSCLPAQCDICGKKLSRAGDMPRHKKTHMKDKKSVLHYCSYCDFSSIQKGNVTVHIRTHTGEKPLSCPDCDESFADPGSLTRHRKRKHDYVPEPRAARDSQVYNTNIPTAKLEPIADLIPMSPPLPSASREHTPLMLNPRRSRSFEQSTLDLLRRSQEFSNAAIEKSRASQALSSGSSSASSVGSSASYRGRGLLDSHVSPGPYPYQTESVSAAPQTIYSHRAMSPSRRLPALPVERRGREVLWTPAPSRNSSPDPPYNSRLLKRSRSPSLYSESRWAPEPSYSRTVRTVDHSHMKPLARRYAPPTPDSPSTQEQGLPAEDSSDGEDGDDFAQPVRFPMSVVRGGN